MEASVGPLMIQKNFVNWNSFTLVKDLTQIHEDFLKRYINPKYFIKLSAKSYKVLQTSLEYSEGNYSLLSGIDSLMEGSWTNLVHPNSNYVLKDSIVSRYLFDKDPENYYKTIQDDYKMKQNCEPQFFILLCLYSFPFLLIGVLMMAFLIVRLKYKKSQYKKINVTERDYE